MMVIPPGHIMLQPVALTRFLRPVSTRIQRGAPVGPFAMAEAPRHNACEARDRLPNPSPRCPAPVRAESIESKIFPDSQGAMIFDDHRVEVVMRILVLVILAVGVVYRAAPAQAQTYDPNYPVCLQIYDDMVHYYFECRYTSIPQCQASASGRAAQCVVNPFYAGTHAKPVHRRKRSHNH
jgi:hypothetical protein